MGDLVYNYLTHEMQGNIVPHFSDWLGYPLPLSNTWSAGSSPPDFVSEQSTPDFMMPSPSYVTRPLISLDPLNIFLQRFPELLPLNPLIATLPNIYPGAPAVSIASTRTELPSSQPIL